MSYSTPKTWTSGALTAAEMQAQVSDNITWLKAALTTHGITSDSVVQALLGARVGCSYYVTGVTVADSSDVAINFAESDKQWEDVSGMHSDGAPSRFYKGGDAGTFQILGFVQFPTDTDGRREVWVEKNDTEDNYSNRIRVAPATGASTNVLTVTEMTMTGTDYLKLMCRHNAGSSLSCNARFTMRRVAVS